MPSRGRGNNNYPLDKRVAADLLRELLGRR